MLKNMYDHLRKQVAQNKSNNITFESLNFNKIKFLDQRRTDLNENQWSQKLQETIQTINAIKFGKLIKLMLRS
jgi:hypothetical protein